MADRLVETGDLRLIESGSIRLLELDDVVSTGCDRLTEAGDLRLTEAGDVRLLEGCPVPPAARQGGGAKWEFADRILDDDEAFILILALA